MTVTQVGRREQLIDRWASTLTTTINDTDTSIVVGSGTGLPTVGDFRIKIEDEIIIIKARSGTTLTVATRGAEGTTAASHTSGVSMKAYLTAGGMKRLLLDARGAPFSEAATANCGPLCRLYGSDHTILTASSFTWLNQGTATATDTNGGIRIGMPSEASNVLRGLYLAIPSTPYTLHAKLRFGPGTVAPGTNSSHAGLFFYQSSSGKLVTLSCRYGEVNSMWRWTNTTTFSAVVDTAMGNNGDAIWLHFTDDGTSLKGYYSDDGNCRSYDAATWFQESRTAFLLTTGPSHCGIYANAGSGLASQIFTFEQVILEAQ